MVDWDDCIQPLRYDYTPPSDYKGKRIVSGECHQKDDGTLEFSYGYELVKEDPVDYFKSQIIER